ncbi:MAG TPA: bifunctional [glutamate--ammonia ligase]-adenylyl-L-tyrosine phosphorylase/[glutamate--ammonia-ligase] adenylyltransferase [Candidatus Hydrogenedentes bacterium]|nr:bifunctional [glutamate--ammonia ligase]-adenylyl-L-tyrosine phosphorylase/[glutamate--ammonia-ligase] adenylyltransferase [Candidatus Hydrogenedentota bacterium]
MARAPEARVRPEFKRVMFADALAAESILAPLLEGNRANLAKHLAEALEESPDASLALIRLDRFLTASRTPNIELDLIDAAPSYARLVIRILGQSHFLTDIACRNPEYMLWLWEDNDLTRTRTREEALTETLRLLNTYTSLDSRGDALRRLRRREILRIAARDIVAHCPVASVADDLSNFADAVTEAALRAARVELETRYGAPRLDDGAAAAFVVIAMGKLGACELNFSSDIDLVFLYDGDGETTGGNVSQISNAEFFNKLGERTIKVLTEQTSEGTLFRVDMRLRPHGRMGPLVVDVDAALRYYELEGQAWERQALIKARPIAGDIALGKRFVERTRPFVFPKFFDDETLEDIRNGKRQLEAQIEQRGETDIEVKLGRGGIRDIEFTVQMLQLLNGGRIPELRVAATLRAIRVLGEHALLKPLDAQTLASNYIFLRQVEHRLQIEGSQQVHRLPTDPADLDAFARRYGYMSGKSFMNDYADRAQATRQILDQFLATEGSGNLWVADLLNPQSDGNAGKDGLRALAFADVEAARSELMTLYAGSPEHPHTLHIRQKFLKVAPALLKAIARTSEPDTTLRRLGQILANLRAPSVIYDALIVNPGLCDHLVTLVENSPYLSELMMRDPGLFDTLGNLRALAHPASREDLEEQLESLLRAFDGEAAPYRLHQGETLRIGMRDLILHIDVEQASKELTQLAEVCLAYAVSKARAKVAERYGQVTARFAVLALGKFAGRELGYGSDLDLVFVYESDAVDGDASRVEYFSAIASNIIRLLKDTTRYGMLYDVDARLRPDGGKGTLVVSDARLAEYYKDDAQPWERLALVKVRYVAGDLEFGQRIAQRARDLAFELPMTESTLANVEDLRCRIVAASSPLSLKKSEGGMAELEFAIRLLQIRYAGKYPSLKRGDVTGALDALLEAELISASDADILRQAYLLFRRIENRLRIEHGKSTSRLPQSLDERSALARRLGIEDDLAALVEDRKRQVHAIYQRILSHLLNTERAP